MVAINRSTSLAGYMSLGPCPWEVERRELGPKASWSKTTNATHVGDDSSTKWTEKEEALLELPKLYGANLRYYFCPEMLVTPKHSWHVLLERWMDSSRAPQVGCQSELWASGRMIQRPQTWALPHRVSKTWEGTKPKGKIFMFEDLGRSYGDLTVTDNEGKEEPVGRWGWEGKRRERKEQEKKKKK